MKDNVGKPNEVIDKLNAFYIYKVAGNDRLREIMPQESKFCEANANKSYVELREELLNRPHQQQSR